MWVFFRIGDTDVGEFYIQILIDAMKCARYAKIKLNLALISNDFIAFLPKIIFQLHDDILAH